MKQSIKYKKDELRKKYKLLRTNMSEDERSMCDRKIMETLTGLYQYKNAKTILTYISTDIEVDTRRLIKKALDDGKCVAVPKCTDDFGMDFYFINSTDDLEISSFGLFEPKTDICRKLKNYKDCFCIVPGMVFDVSGYRIGYGKGYYDRFLSEFTGTTAGICYSNCVKWKRPRGFYDRSVDILVTDRYFRKCSSRYKNEE